MTRDEFDQLLDDLFEQVRKINDSKGLEYATHDDALANFRRRGAELGLSPLQVWGIFYGKHHDAILSYLRRGGTLSEPIEGRIHDAILYLALLAGLVAEQEAQRG